MNKIFSFIFLVLIAIGHNAAHAGSLGVCKRCVSSSNIEANVWTKGGGSLGFCAGLGMTDGGDGDPVLCDAQAGVVRFGDLNDPFWRCGINASSHGAWIGGENRDLVVLSPEIDNIRAGTLFRVQDGDDYRCGLDFVSGDNFSILKRGENRDIIDLWISDGQGGFRQTTDRLQNGKFHALIAGRNYAAVLYGENKDIVKIYGVTPTGAIVEKSRFINDGKDHTIHKLSDTDFGITYGNNDDVRLRLCFTGSKWQTGYLGIKQPYAGSCDTDLAW